MHVVSLATQKPFITRDGSTIRSILDRTNAPVRQQSLAEATMNAGQVTERHYHRASEELYFILEGDAEMQLGDVRRAVGAGDAILIPAGEWHSIKARTSLRFLCCCAPPYSHDDTFLE